MVHRTDMMFPTSVVVYPSSKAFFYLLLESSPRHTLTQLAARLQRRYDNCKSDNWLLHRHRTSEKKSFLTILDGEGAAQPAVVTPGRIGADETRLEDFDLVGLLAQHDNLVRSA